MDEDIDTLAQDQAKDPGGVTKQLYLATPFLMFPAASFWEKISWTNSCKIVPKSMYRE